MQIPRLYCPQLVSGGNVLSAEESHHAVTVLRLRKGDRAVLFDGAGQESEGTVANASKRRMEIAVVTLTRRAFETLHRLTLAVALAKAHRHAYLVEKCTELGVAGFWPILAERSVTKRSPSPPGRGAGGRATAVSAVGYSPSPPGRGVRGEGEGEGKLHRRAVEAAKQSHRAWIPTFAELQPLVRAIHRIPEFTAAAIADIDATDAWPAFLSQQPAGATLLAFVGPEGGFSPAECDQLIAAGAHPVRLASTVLRTETAAVALCAAEAAIPLSLRERGQG